MAPSVSEADPLPMEATPTPSSKESVALPLIVENKVTAEPSIPLRKEAGDALPTPSTELASKRSPKLSATIPVPPKHPETKKITFTKPIFTPRQLANPVKNKKLQKKRTLPILGNNRVGASSSASAVEHPSSQNEKVPTDKLEPVGTVKSICAPTPTQALVSPPPKPTHPHTLLDMAAGGTVDNRGVAQQEPIGSASEEARKGAKVEEDFDEGGGKVAVQKKEQAMKEVNSGVFAPMAAGDSNSMQPNTMAPKNEYFTAAVGGSLSSPTSTVGMQAVSATSSSKQQKVAMVSPLPQSSALAGAKPVARVKPNLHLDPLPVPKSTEFRRTTSCGFKVSESLTPPSPNLPSAQASKSSPWLVTAKGKQGAKSREGGVEGGPPMRSSFSDATPTGWKVTEFHKHMPTSGSEDVFGSSSKSLKKKKKKHRHHSRVSSPSDFSDSDSDCKPRTGSGGSKHHKYSHDDREGSRRRADAREHARKRSRRDLSDSEATGDYYSYNRSCDYDEHRRHGKKHRRAHKKHKMERERERRCEKERRKYRCHSTTSYIYSSDSSDSEEDGQRKRHHKEDRKNRDCHRYGDKRHDQYHSSRDHHHHHHHHHHHPHPSSSRHRDHTRRSSSPPSDGDGGERRKRKDRWYERSDRSRSPISDSKRTKFGCSVQREGKDATEKVRKGACLIYVWVLIHFVFIVYFFFQTGKKLVRVKSWK